jgi:methyltransferase-like protein/SAM-dependent methyltransferase
MTNYDEIPYPLLSHVQSHPDSLATIATLLGLSPAPVESCRVLELGCASGGNLIPAAISLPGSQFVGIDQAASQIEAGQASAAGLGLHNVTLRQMDIREVTPELGEFDYIIAHGVYSWVPADVRDGLWAICSQNLAPEGLAYISYNTYPGWHMLGSLREMMLYHVRESHEAGEKASRARGLLDFLASAAPVGENGRSDLVAAYARFLQHEMSRIGKKADAYLLHDELEDYNEPVYFHDFMRQAESHGLQFVSEVEFRSSLPHTLPESVSKSLLKMAGNIVEMEQYLDFVRSRTFRQTLLCRQDKVVDRRLTPDRLGQFRVAARAVPESARPSIHQVTVEKFKGADGAKLAIDHPLSKAAMVHLAELWPQTLAFNDVLPAALRRLQLEAGAEPAAAEPQDASLLAANLLKAFVYSESLVELHLRPDRFVVEVSERPLASPWARQQALRGEEKVTNMRHERVALSSLSHFLLSQVDGTRDCAALVDLLLAGPVAESTLVVQQDSQPISDPEQARRILASEVAVSLQWLARAALLVG